MKNGERPPSSTTRTNADPHDDPQIANLVDTLDAYGVLFVVYGGYAANRYRDQTRFTSDYDLIADSREQLIAALESIGLAPISSGHADQDQWLITFSFNDHKIDIAIAETPIQFAAIARGQANSYVVTIEDLLAFKILGNRPKDLDDIRSIARRGLPLDLRHILDQLEPFRGSTPIEPGFNLLIEMLEKHHPELLYGS